MDASFFIAGSHKYQLLEKARTDLEAEIDEMLKEISKKITELCNLEKNTWQTVDELTENCEKMVNQVDECVNKKVPTFCWNILYTIKDY